MFGIKINGEFLNLPERFKIRLRLENTLFQREYKNTAYTFPATVPDDDHNRRLLSYASDVQVKSGTIGTNGTPCVLVCGVLEWECLLWADRSIFTKELQVSLKVIGSTTGKKLLTDLEYGGVRNVPGTDGNDLPENIEVTNNYTHSKDRDYYWGMYFNASSVITPGGGIINDIDITGTFDVVATALTIPAISRYTPMAYLNYVLRKIAADMGVNVDGNWWEDDELDSLVIFNNRTMERFFVAPPTIPNGWIWDDLNLKYHLPIMVIDDFIGALKNMFCLMIETFNGKFTISSFKDILSDFKINDWTAKSHRVYERSRIPVNGFDIQSTYDPADKMYETYVKPLKLLNYLGELSTTPPTATEGEFYFHIAYKSYYVYRSGSWVYFSFGAEGVKTGDGELVYETPMTAPIFRTLENPPLGKRMPWVEMDSEGQYTSIGEDEITDFGPRLVFARGWYDQQIFSGPALGIFIPVISGEAIDYDNNIWGNYCLRYKQDEGLHKVWWEDFLAMAIENDNNIFDLEMTDADLGKWTFGEFLRVGGEVFYPKALDVELSRKGVEVARVETLRWNG